MPVALNTDRLSKGEDGDFFRELMKRWPQGLWVVTPEGKTLAFHYHKPEPKKNYAQNQKAWVDDTAAMLEEGLKAAGESKPRNARAVNPFPDRGLGLSKEGGVRLAVTVIGMNRTGKQEGSPAVDSAILTKDEWAGFAPQDGGKEWTLPDSAAKKFAVALAPVTDSIFVPLARDLTKAELSGVVVRTDVDVVVIQFTGTWESKHFRDGNPKFPITATSAGIGIAVYDRKTMAVVSVLFVLKGSYQNGTAVTGTAAVIEWRAEKAKEE